MINIDFCNRNEITEVQKFINEHWEKDHILANNIILLKWLYKNKEGYNFIIAKKNDVIIGLLGFIKNSHFDNIDIIKDIIWLALWKVNEKIASPGLGLLLLKKLEKMNPNLDIAVLGINKTHPPMYKAINYYTGIMDHYYVTNPENKNFNILIYDNETKLPTPIISEFKLIYKQVLIEDFKDKRNNYKSKNFSFYKSVDFFINKYLKHPFYDYKLFDLQKDSRVLALIVLRVINIKNSKVIRVIDFEGDERIISYLGEFFLELMKGEQAEYVDFLQHGINKKYFLDSGFDLLGNKKTIIVPNYFEPIIQKNTPLLFSYKIDNKNKIRIFKGDGDQDRPNLVDI